MLTGVLLNSTAQLFLKQGMWMAGHFPPALKNILPIGFQVSLNPYIFPGMVCYAVSIVIWLMVLSRVDVSYVYPILSVGYIVTAFTGNLFFGEAIELSR